MKSHWPRGLHGRALGRTRKSSGPGSDERVRSCLVRGSEGVVRDRTGGVVRHRLEREVRVIDPMAGGGPMPRTQRSSLKA